MKPFITNSKENGRPVLRLQCEGAKSENLKQLLEGLSITAYALPEGHSLASAWQLRFIFNNQLILEFSSVCTEVVGWQEVGSLNVKVIDDTDQFSNIFSITEIKEFLVTSVEYLVYEDSDAYSECGLVLRSSLGEEVIIAAGVSPGSVSVQAPFSTLDFEPEFPTSDYQRKSM
ncbi:hypothetical protein [Chitinimonas sp. BJB300]|uniref:hypothetical protein n=1 Tax=Chitinimonas sp. BJB300 TaxID=1559339 RepID=UPI000C1077AB|nr:hypothetical protein [Chitinimonas sp. BJB300]PHV09511.1 hypothetical protein CSQ89_21365 [Chitinimonas sp. BJB300]TSJ83755.1 hypothetical protein FG002_021050 [Chitinimonas sp. BJB300]